MARFRPTDPSNSRKDRHPKRIRGQPTVDETALAQGPWGVVSGGEGCWEDTPAAAAVAPPAAVVKLDDEEDNVVLPTPIAQGLWKVTSPDGREVHTYQPLHGFEHLFRGGTQSQGAHSTYFAPHTVPPSHRQAATAASGETASRLHSTYMQGINNSQQARDLCVANSIVEPPSTVTEGSRKRRRPAARQPAQRRTAINSSDDDDDCDDGPRAAIEESYTSYIGNFVELKKFFRRRFEELSTKPIRPIVTAWIKLLEPKRLAMYGAYHKKLPSEALPECTPPWWPRDVPYSEPAHLNKIALFTLAVELLLQHRRIDEPKRNGSWLAKLQQAAQYAFDMTPPELFSASDVSEFGARMKERAINFVLPSLFDVAQTYEDHVTQYRLYEGSGNVDPGKGTNYTWRPFPRPPRPTPRKRRLRPKASPAPQADSDVELSGNETAVDETVSRIFLRREEAQAWKKARTSKGSEDATMSQQQMPNRLNLPATTAEAPTAQYNVGFSVSADPSPCSSFDQAMDGPRFCEVADTGVEESDQLQYSDQGSFPGMFPPGQLIPYSNSHPEYSNQMLQPQVNTGPCTTSGQSLFTSAPTSAFAHPYSLFGTIHTPPVGSSGFVGSVSSSQASFPYDYEGFFPASSQNSMRFHRLPCDFESHESHHG